MVEKLHEIGILHGSLSERNIVYDKNLLGLINFNMSRNILDLASNDINHYKDIFSEGVKYAEPESNDVEYILRLEMEILDYFPSHIPS